MDDLEQLTKKTRDFLNNEKLFEHSLAVAKTAQNLAERFGENPYKAYTAGILHDIGGIYPNDKRIQIAEEAGINLLPEEREFPLIIHQKLSKFLARWKFGIFNDEILNAIECHTTLRANFTKLDIVLFLADKISWDGGDAAPFKKGLLEKLEISMEAAALFYIDFILDDGVKVIHPWLLAARAELIEKSII